MIDVEIKCTCLDCNKDFPEEDVIIRCEECDEKSMEESIKYTIGDIKDKSYLWEDKEGYTGFDSDKELECFMIGLRRGYLDAIFWICDRYGITDFFEKLEFKQPSWRENK